MGGVDAPPTWTCDQDRDYFVEEWSLDPHLSFHAKASYVRGSVPQ